MTVVYSRRLVAVPGDKLSPFRATIISENVLL